MMESYANNILISNRLSVISNDTTSLRVFDSKSNLFKEMYLEDTKIVFEHSPAKLSELLLNLELWEKHTRSGSDNISSLCSFLRRETLDAKDFLARFEPFLRSVHGIVFEGLKKKYLNKDYYLSTGLPVDGSSKPIVLYSRHFLRLSSVPGWEFNDTIDGKQGITDTSIDYVRRLSEAFRVCRNLQLHGTPEGGTNNIDTEEVEPVLKQNFDDIAHGVANTLLILIAHVLDYRYDTLSSHIRPVLEQFDSATAHTEQDATKLAIDYIKDKYLNYIISHYSDKLSGETMINLTFTPDATILSPDDNTQDDEDDDVPQSDDTGIATIEDLLEENERMLICGPSGAGKSTTMSRAMVMLAREWEPDSATKPLPVRFDLKNFVPNINLLTQCMPEDKVTIISDGGKQALSGFFTSQVKNGCVLFILDGLNEVPTNIQTELTEYLKIFFNDTYPKARLIITSRYDEARSIFPAISKSITHNGDIIKGYRINPLNDKQIDEYARRRVRGLPSGSLSSTEHAIIEKLHSTPELGSLASNPLQLRIITDLLSNDDTIDTDRLNRTILYERYIESFLKREFAQQKRSEDNMAKGIKDFEFNLGRLASMFLEGRTCMYDGQPKVYVSESALTGDQCRFAERLGLISVSDDEYISFAHDSFYNFFTAKRLILLMKGNVEEIPALVQKHIVEPSQIELLRMIIELLVSTQYDKKKNVLPALLTSYLNIKEDRADGEVVNPGLTVLASIMPSIPRDNYAWESAKSGSAEMTHLSPHALFDSFVINIMSEVRESVLRQHTLDTSTVFTIFMLIAHSSSPVLVDHLFTPFWLQLWAISTEDRETLAEKFPMLSLTQVDRQVLGYARKALFLQLADPVYFMSRLFDLWTKLKIAKLSSSFQKLGGLLVHCLHQYTDAALHKIFDNLISNSKTIPYTQDYALTVLMSMSDPSWIDRFEAYDYENSSIPINKQLLSKQIVNILQGTAESDRIFRVFNNILRKNTAYRLNLKTFLYNVLSQARIYDKEVIDSILQSDATKRSLGTILDNYPLSAFSTEQVRAMGWDKDAHRLTLDTVEEEIDRLPYVTVGISAKKVSVIIPDIKEAFDEKSILLPDLDPTGVAKRAYHPYKVMADGRIILRHVQFGIRRRDNSPELLPLSGTMTISYRDKDATNEFTYLASRSDHKGLVFTSWQGSLTPHLEKCSKGLASVAIGGVSCEVEVLNRGGADKYYRRLTLEREKDTPAYSSLAIPADSDGTPLDDVDHSIGSELGYRDRFFIDPLVNNKVNNSMCRYSVYGYSADGVILLTEAINIEPGQDFSVDGVDATTVSVVKVDDHPSHFVELYLSCSDNVASVARYGRLIPCRNAEDIDIDGRIPYVAALKQGQRFIVRVSDPAWVQRLSSDAGLVRSMVKERVYKINGVSCRVTMVDVIKHIPNSKLVTVRTDNADEIPQRGSLRPRAGMGFKYLPHMRVITPVIAELTSEGTTEEGLPIFAVSKDIPQSAIRRTSYFRSNLNPRIGHMRKLAPTDADEPVKYCFDAPVYKVPAGEKIFGVRMLAYWPVNNDPDESVFNLKNTYTVTNVHYRLMMGEGRLLRMPAPNTPVEGLHCEVDGNPPLLIDKEMCEIVNDSRVPYYQFLHIRIPDDYVVESEGNLKFYYDAECLHPAVLCYDKILTQIELNAPERYHGDTCRLVFKEAGSTGYFSSQICEMLKKHNLSHMLLREFVSDSGALRAGKYPQDLRFNTHLVLNRKSTHICVFSGIDRRVGFISNTNPAVTVDSVVLVEENGDIYPVSADMPARSTHTGFLTGVVLRIDYEKQDVHIRAANEDKDFFYHYYGDEAIDYGTIVSFFPTINHITKQPMAAKLVVIGQGRHKGTVVKTEMREQGCHVTTIYDKDNPGVTLESYHYPYAGFFYDLALSLQVGDEVEYIFPNGGLPRNVSDKESVFINAKSIPTHNNQ